MREASGYLPREVWSLAGLLWGAVILLVVLWVLVKVIFGIAGALFHLLLVVAVVVVVYNLIKAGAARRT